MNNEEIAEELKEIVDNRIMELSDKDYCDVLYEVASMCKISADCKTEEMENEDEY